VFAKHLSLSAPIFTRIAQISHTVASKPIFAKVTIKEQENGVLFDKSHPLAKLMSPLTTRRNHFENSTRSTSMRLETKLCRSTLKNFS
jgi:hypothetical protein